MTDRSTALTPLSARLKNFRRLFVVDARPPDTSAQAAVLEVLHREARPLSPVEVWDAAAGVTAKWGRERRYSSRAIGGALTDLRAAGRVRQDGERAPYYLPGPEPTAVPSEP